MKNLNDLIHDIQDSETIELGGKLDEVTQKRIENKIVSTIKKEHASTRPRLSRRFAIALAATMVMALGITTVAARTNEWDILLLNSMGISNPDTLQLESGEVQINQSVTSQVVDYATEKETPQTQVTLTATSSIGDQNTAYIKLMTDYELPDNFNPETDYILPSMEGYKTDITLNNGYGSSFGYIMEDNKLGFILEISNCTNLNRATVSLHLSDLYWHHDLNGIENAPEEELLCEGSWDLKWTFRYQSNTDTYLMHETLQGPECPYYLTKVEISPISVRMEAYRKSEDRDKTHENKWLDAIIFKDGTVLEIQGNSGSGLHNQTLADSYVDLYYLGGPINPGEIEKLVIMGKEISLK